MLAVKFSRRCDQGYGESDGGGALIGVIDRFVDYQVSVVYTVLKSVVTYKGEL
jgi:hypothetical protein